MLPKYFKLLVSFLVMQTSCSVSDKDIGEFVGQTILQPDSTVQSVMLRRGKGVLDTMYHPFVGELKTICNISRITGL